MSMKPAKPKRAQNLNAEQSLAVHPATHTWLSASAGTGKTQVLSARVLRLLLSGVSPEHILCITFTKAGAAEMQHRVRGRLAAWVQMDDKTLRDELRAIGTDNVYDAHVLADARCLFAKVIDAQGGGLRVQTIHAFCQTLLSAFPEEAGLAPGFQPVEGNDAALLERAALNQLIEDATRSGDQRLLGQLRMMALTMAEADVTAYLSSCTSRLEALDALAPLIAPQLRAYHQLPAQDADRWLVKQCTDEALDRASWLQLASGYAAVRTAKGAPNKNTEKQAAAIRSFFALEPGPRAESLNILHAAIFTSKGETRTWFADDKDMGAYQALALDQLRPRLLATLSTHEQMVEVDRIGDMLEAGRAYARAYANAKRDEGLVDFDDLIARTIALLERQDQSEWVRYKLDSKIDHLLLDEAQDTNLDQWRIVKSLTDEFFAGQGQKVGIARTLFVVGDHKQAIYRFQGTDPDMFSAFQEWARGKAVESEQPLADISLTDNYRSSAPILALVDGVIATLGNAAFGLAHDDPIRHTAAAAGAPGRITIWPLQSVDDDADDEAEISDTNVTAEQLLVADRIARSVRAMIDEGVGGEPVMAGDIMVLLRRRGGLASVIVSQLQAQGVPVAGVDRLRLQRPIAVQDLLAALRFVLQPLDDLNLSALLVSPLCGWTHGELMERAQRPLVAGESRRRVPLWRHLREQSALAEAIAPLRTMLDLAGYVGPFAFLEAILSGEIAGRAKLLARLGEAARDPIEELLSQALAFETRHGPSLHGFVRWFDSYDEDITREFEGKADAVRVMTVHGSKGLQARIVILADAGDAVISKGGGGKSKPLMWGGDDRLPLPGDIPLPRKTAKKTWPPVWQRAVDDDAAKELQENRRLLYVAMTRAERMLFVAGRKTKQSDNDPPRWHDLIEQQTLAMGGGAEDDPVWGTRTVYAVGASGRAPRQPEADRTNEMIVEEKPAWLHQPPPAELRPPRPLAPSRMSDDAALSVAQPPRDAGNIVALERGRMLHIMFELLPQSTPAQQEQYLRRWLTRQQPSLDDAEREAMIASVIDLATAPDYAALFGAEALAEVPFSAVVDGEVIAGTVDRMIVSDDAVRIVDFKTSECPPTRAEGIHRGHRLQMAAYRRAMQAIFPDHSISVGLLFTANARLFWLADALLDRDWAERRRDKAGKPA